MRRNFSIKRSISRAANTLLILSMLLAAAGVSGVVAAPAGTALQFNGSNQYVTFGAATSTLGTQNFTLEAWIKRESGGATMTSGSLGFDGAGGRPSGIYPVISKGMGEGDSVPNKNMNYIFGITSTFVVGADFEDNAGGVNHPIWGSTLVSIGVWHHIAVTYSGTCWALYLDGKAETLNGTVCPNATPEFTSIQHAGLAAALSSIGQLAAGFFSGSIDEPRIWNFARTQGQIQADLYNELSSGSGLLGRWGLNDGTGATATNSIAGSPNGTITNSPSWVTGFPLPLSAPTGLNATPGDASISLSWTAHSDSDLAGYNLYRGTDGISFPTKVNPTLITGTSRTDFGLTNGITYYYVLTAVNSVGAESLPSDQASATPVNAAPSAPTGLTATPGNTTVALSWTANGEGDLAGYNVYRSETSPVALTSPINGGTLVTGTTYPDSGLSNGSPYYYVITAVDTGALESGASNEASATPSADTTAPAAPTGLTPTVQLGSIRLDWTAPADLDLNGFNIYRATSPGVPLTGPLNGGTPLSKTTLTYTDSTVVKDTTYYYVVTAVDTSANQSGASNEVNGRLAAGLQFDGTDDFVNLGNTTGLGVTNFTLETWFYWTGGGVCTTTGASQGIPSVIPLISKGRSDGADGGTTDINYFLGIDCTNSNHPLAVDFEANPGGQNYPFITTAPVSINTWHHAAVTYDSVTAVYNVYLDGALAGTSDKGSNIVPRSDSIDYAGIGSALTSVAGSQTGFFAGKMDEVRVWNVVRTMAQIRTDINNQLTSGTGLIARWGLDEGTGTTANSSFGSFPGTLTNGPTWITPGAPFNLVLDTTPPAAPTTLSATPGNTTVALNWSASSEGDLYGYNIYRSTSPSVPITSPIASVVKPTVTYTDTGRVNGQIYYYVITAVDTSGNQSGASNEVNATPVGMPPAAPSGLTVTPTTNYSLLNLAWTDNSTDETGFEIERSTTGIGGTYSLLFTTAANAVSYKNFSLSPSTEYCYRVRAVNASGASAYTSNVCATTPAEGDYGLQFDGTNDYVTFGLASGLGVSTFTIEAWIYRAPSGGVLMGTGTAGLGDAGLPQAYPLVTKGRGQADSPANLNMNYWLGIASTGVIAADFEDSDNGLNHPILGTTIVSTDAWHHVAITYGAGCWNVYLDGVLDPINSLTTQCPKVHDNPAVSAIPEAGSIQHAALGTALQSLGTLPADSGYFAGKIDEVRIWNYARTLSEIRSTVNSQLTSGTGLVARWGLNEGTDIIANSPVGSFPGTLTNGPAWVTTGAPFNLAFDTTPPAAPNGLYAIGANGSASLDWDNNTDSDLAGYNVYRGTTSGVYAKVNSSLVLTSAYSDTGLVNGTEYYYVVRAVDTSSNESGNSNEAYTIPQLEAGSALQFITTSGTYVTFGDPAKLDLAAFTIETWFKRTGTGTPNTTGTGGIASALPLVTHGSPEAEGGTVDANWMLVINDSSDVIGFDFEDMATGGNHPLSGVTPITDNTWHHAAATFDGTTVRLYLDGKLESSLVPGALPRSDTTQQAALGTMITTTGTANGFFQGVIDEARVWNRALTQTEILTNINHQITSGSGLVARWGLNEGTGTAVNDSVATAANGTITGTNYAWVPGAPFNLNLAPAAPTLVSPADAATGVSTSASLSVHVTDALNVPLTVSFYGRQKTGAPGTDFSLIAIPDPQYYAATYPSIYNAQMNWVVSNKATLSIPFVVSLGDNVNTASTTSEWTTAATAWDILTSGGVPYGLTVGNHDGAPSSTSNFNTYFGSRLSSQTEFGGRYGTSDYDNTFFTFTGDGMDFIVLFIEYDTTMTSTSNPVLVWANTILAANSSRRAIVVTHDLLSGNNFSAQGQAIYDALKGNPNLFLMLGGHLDTTGQRSDIYNGHTVYSLRSDYQFTDSQQSGYLRIMRFSPTDNQIHVTTYSPNQAKYLTDSSNQFNLPYAMDGVADFALIGSTTVPSGSDATVSWSGLTNNTEYEWYAVADNGGGATVSSTWSFTTEAASTVTISGNAGTPSATITYTGGSTTSDGSGNYTFTVASGWTGTVTPSKTEYTFTPDHRDYSTAVTSNQTGQDFTATLNTYLLTVSKIGTGFGTVTSAPAGIDCGSTCLYSFDYPTSVTLTAAVTDGTTTFTGWSGEGCSGTGTCVVTMTAARNVTATFTRNVHSIDLVTGWNLVSFNLHPVDTTLATVLAGIPYDLVYAWDATGAHSGSGNWLKADTIPVTTDTLTNLDETRGFWIHVTAPATLNVIGSKPVDTTISLLTAAGTWNLVSYAGISDHSLPEAFSTHGAGTDFSLVFAYHAGDTGDPWKIFDRIAPGYSNDLTALSPGWGYWVKVSADHSWVISYAIP